MYFIYGLSTMFYLMMTWLFWRKGADRLSRLVCLLMLVACLENITDLVLLAAGLYFDARVWNLTSAIDMVIVPLYGFVLGELVRPGETGVRSMFLQALPFLMLPALLAVTGREEVYYLNIALAAVFGTTYLVATFMEIPRYHRKLKELFSYGENINLHWLRVIILFFYGILALWIVDSVVRRVFNELLYMVCSLVMWVFISYFIYRHENVIDELRPPRKAAGAADGSSNDIGAALHRLFVEERLYLTPGLKLSDVAKRIGTNRTYLSQYFNRDGGTTFYDYVNNLRIDHAERLLADTGYTQEKVAENSGFNSLSTFLRAFKARHKCTPLEYRNSAPPISIFNTNGYKKRRL